MADASALTQVVQGSVDSLKPFLFWASKDYDLEMARAFVRLTREGREKGRELHLGIFDAQTEEFLGMMGLMHMKAITLGFEIGYWLSSQRQGEGLCTEAARQIILYAFEELDSHRVWLNCDVKNKGSRRVAEKLGMRREGRVKAFLIDPEGNARDHYLYGLLKSEFKTAF
ncbi:GNAT family N-acetyltransferase [bacterium]|nr:GNAT family N-acetyltransferase [bacterium]